MLESVDKEKAVELLSDDYIVAILSSTHIKAKSAKEISKKNDIPIAVCYRRINQLVDLGLLEEEERALTQDGKRIWLYKSNLKTAQISYEEGKLKARFELANGRVETFDDEKETVKVESGE